MKQLKTYPNVYQLVNNLKKGHNQGPRLKVWFETEKERSTSTQLLESHVNFREIKEYRGSVMFILLKSLS